MLVAEAQQPAESGKAHAHLLEEEPEAFTAMTEEILGRDRRAKQIVIIDMEEDFRQTGYTP